MQLSSQGSSAGGAIVDWAKGQSLPANMSSVWRPASERSYTVPKDGLVVGITENSQSSVYYFTVNGISIPSVCHQSVTESLGDDRPYDKTTITDRYMAYVKKGDVIRYKECYGVAFYPLR